jgi:hypothetical protein
MARQTPVGAMATDRAELSGRDRTRCGRVRVHHQRRHRPEIHTLVRGPLAHPRFIAARTGPVELGEAPTVGPSEL